MIVKLPDWWAAGAYMLSFVAIATIVLEVWMLIEALIMWPQARGVLEQTLPPLQPAPVRERARR
jgi:carbon starvation protein